MSQQTRNSIGYSFVDFKGECNATKKLQKKIFKKYIRKLQWLQAKTNTVAEKSLFVRILERMQGQWGHEVEIFEFLKRLNNIKNFN